MNPRESECVCACVCVCVRERERERETGRATERATEREVLDSLPNFLRLRSPKPFCFFFFSTLQVLEPLAECYMFL